MTTINHTEEEKQEEKSNVVHKNSTLRKMFSRKDIGVVLGLSIFANVFMQLYLGGWFLPVPEPKQLLRVSADCSFRPGYFSF